MILKMFASVQESLLTDQQINIFHKCYNSDVKDKVIAGLIDMDINFQSTHFKAFFHIK